VHPLPENASFEQGAAIDIPYLTAYRALFQLAQARAGESILVHYCSRFRGPFPRATSFEGDFDRIYSPGVTPVKHLNRRVR
jgi:hypothetical protein